jgi:hypothetical protein
VLVASLAAAVIGSLVCVPGRFTEATPAATPTSPGSRSVDDPLPVP